MKKNLPLMLIMLAMMAGGVSLMAQWAQYHGNDLPQDDATANIADDGTVLISGTSSIIVDPDDATNNLWQFDIDLGMGDAVGYNWYPSYYVIGGETPFVPAPSTVVCKFKWLDTNSHFGPDIEVREKYKVQTKILNDSGTYTLKVKDWNLDSIYNMPETFDPLVWHVLRLSVNEGAWNVYLDEDPTAFASGMAGKEVNKHLAIFGAWTEADKSRVLVDWMGYLESSAASPTEMPLPAGIFDPSTSIRSHENSALFHIYPNPARSAITLKLESDYVNSNYEIINITGQVVERGVVLSESSQIDVSDMNSGMYMIKVTSASRVLSESFIVE